MILAADVGSRKDLVKYRLEAAHDTLEEAHILMQQGKNKGANNRIYYSVFQSLLAIHSMDKTVVKSHKRAIGEFNVRYVHSGIFPSDYTKRISNLEIMRNDSDYSNFFIPDDAITRKNYQFAEQFIAEIKDYCEKRMATEQILEDFLVNNRPIRKLKIMKNS